MGEFYDIGVVGESMSGKSTWIASLFRKDIAEQLQQICKENNEGQTKITVHYQLKDVQEEGLTVKAIGWDMGALSEAVKNEKLTEAINSIKSLVKLPEEQDLRKSGIFEQTFENDHNCPSVDKVFAGIVNNDAVNSTGIIAYIKISGPASLEVWELMQSFELDSVRLRDTRGFLDESLDKIQKISENLKKINEKECDSLNNKNQNEEEYLYKLPNDRGLSEIDGCVFMSVAGSNTLNKKNCREIYGSLIKELLEKHPVFLTVRADKVMEVYEDNPNISYTELLVKDGQENYLRLGKYFTGFDDLHKLLMEYGLQRNLENLYTEIAKMHYTELVLANIPYIKTDTESGLENKNRLMDYYQRSAVGAFKEVLSKVNAYRKGIAKAKQFLASINTNDKLKPLYNEEFLSGIEYIKGRNVYSNKMFICLPSYLVRRIQGQYFGEMVGPREGLTTRVPEEGRMIGDAAIYLLESAYYARKRLLLKLVDQLEPEIKARILQNGVKDDADLEETVQWMKKNLILQLNRETDANTEYLCAVGGPMISRRFLWTACINAKKDLEITSEKIGRYLPELESLPESVRAGDGGRWEHDKYMMSVAKYVLWSLVSLQL